MGSLPITFIFWPGLAGLIVLVLLISRVLRQLVRAQIGMGDE